MFAISARVSPWSARSSPRSVGRVTVSVPFSCSIAIRVGTTWRSSPFGPWTATRAGSTVIVTPAGISMGLLPMRLMPFACSSSPDEADHFPADALALGGAARDAAAGGRKDGDPHPPEHARQTVLARVDSAAGLRDALQVGDDALAAAAVLEGDDEDAVGQLVASLDVEVADVALLLEDAGELLLQLRRRHLGVVVQRLVGVADPREHVSDWIGQHLGLLPGALGHARDHALVGELPQADAADPELLEDGTRPPALVAAGVVAHLELLRARRLHDQRLLGHALLLVPPCLGGERQAQPQEERPRLLVVLGGGRDRDIEAADLVDAVVVDLGEDDLLADADRIVAATVEGARVEPAEVADPRQRDRDQPVDELPHPVAAQRHARADRHPLAELELGERLLRPAHLRPLARDDRELLDRGVEDLRLGLRLADAHVERDLRDPRDLH